MRISPGLPAAGHLLSEGALLLDLDGTLLDIAPRPDAVVVPPGLCAQLASLSARMKGALGIITGRGLPDADRLLAPLRLPIAAEHGRVLRLVASASPWRVPGPDMPAAWVAAARAFAAAHPGVIFEPKSAGFVLHYRLAPEHGAPALDLLRRLLAGQAAFTILPAAMAWEVRAHVADKGTGLRALMAEPGFAGRIPYFIGDDVTDEDAIAAATALGGAGFRMAEHFASPAALRAWLGELNDA
jgi:trehalose 6-phosphate phosphatase